MSNNLPFFSKVGVVARFPRIVDMVVRGNPPMSNEFKLWMAGSLDDAYGTLEDSGISGSGGVAIGTCRTSKTFMSSQSPLAYIQTSEYRPNDATFLVNPEDYTDGGVLPPNESLLFARVQEYRPTIGWVAVPSGASKNSDVPIKGPITLVPDSSISGVGSYSFSVAGTAPGGTDCAALSRPVYDLTVQKPLPMHIVFPKPISTLTLRNNDDENSILYALGPNQTMLELPFGQTTTISPGGTAFPSRMELVIAANGSDAVSFSVDGVMSTLF